LATSNLATRLLTAGIGGPLILALLYFGPPWGWFAFICVAGAIGVFELFEMTFSEDRTSQVLGTAMGVAVISVLWLWAHDAKVLLTLLLVTPVVGMALVLWRLGEMRTAGLRVAVASFGPLYLGGGLASIALLRRDAGPDGPAFVVLALMLAWLSDTGGYFAGRFLGKHKLYEAVSPKKTVEGAVGGLVGGVAGAMFAHFLYLRSLPLVDGLVLGVVGSALGQVGDLGESLIKRSSGVKDSGGIVPGHGGILDRIDALLVTSAITYLYVLWARL